MKINLNLDKIKTQLYTEMLNHYKREYKKMKQY